jgi:hypothetical protein
MTDQQPFEGVESYYQQLFQQIKGRHHPEGTGGDMDCLIAMVEWLWNRFQRANSAPSALVNSAPFTEAIKLPGGDESGYHAVERLYTSSEGYVPLPPFLSPPDVRPPRVVVLEKHPEASRDDLLPSLSSEQVEVQQTYLDKLLQRARLRFK